MIHSQMVPRNTESKLKRIDTFVETGVFDRWSPNNLSALSLTGYRRVTLRPQTGTERTRPVDGNRVRVHR